MLAGAAHSAEIKVISSGAVKETYLELVAQFEKASNHKVVTLWSGTADIMKRIRAGESADIIILGSNSIDELIQLGHAWNPGRSHEIRSGRGGRCRRS